MFRQDQIPAPFLCNPIKHHLGFIRTYISEKVDPGVSLDNSSILKELKHLGGSQMDVYSGSLGTEEIITGIYSILDENDLIARENFVLWTGKNPGDFKTITLSDGSVWVLKYFNGEQRYIHPFPMRYSPQTFRIKANTLKSAILYLIFVGKDYVTEEDLNLARAVGGLSPVKEVVDAEAIMEMIEMLREAKSPDFALLSLNALMP
jgi:hypothetical protein